MLFKEIKTESAKAQYELYQKNNNVLLSTVLKFEGVEGYDVYNPSIPFELNGKTYILGRVEKRNEEFSKINFFEEKTPGVWIKVPSKELTLQDPFVTIIHNKVILGGVNVTWGNGKDIETTWKTDFYQVNDLFDINYLTCGPAHMKDIRLLELPNKKILVMSRPQGGKLWDNYHCIAKIGMTIINDLSELTPENIDKAPYLEGQFLPDEWGGANQLHNLKNGLVGVIGHKSYKSFDCEGKQQLHYYGMAFVINPLTKELSQTKIIISKDKFPEVPAKRPDLVDITFTSGIIRNNDGTCDIYTGIGDTSVGKAKIVDPFKEFE